MKPRYTADLEFLEDGTTIDLISIGIVGITVPGEYYAVNADMPLGRILEDKWLMKHVMSSIPMIGDELDPSNPDLKPRTQIRDEVKDFLLRHGPCELWGWYDNYDSVAVNQLWGKMIDKPRDLPILWLDMAQEAYLSNVGMPHQAAGNHNALEDARFNVKRYERLRDSGALWRPKPKVVSNN